MLCANAWPKFGINMNVVASRRLFERMAEELESVGTNATANAG